MIQFAIYALLAIGAALAFAAIVIDQRRLARDDDAVREVWRELVQKHAAIVAGYPEGEFHGGRFTTERKPR